MKYIKNAFLVLFVSLGISWKIVAAPRPASVKMYPKTSARMQINPSCDVYTQGEFGVGGKRGFFGRLMTRVSAASQCELASPTVRYELVFFGHPQKDRCGSFQGKFGAVKYVAGRMEKDADGQPVVYEGNFSDHRERMCDGVGAQLVVIVRSNFSTGELV